MTNARQQKNSFDLAGLPGPTSQTNNWADQWLKSSQLSISLDLWLWISYILTSHEISLELRWKQLSCKHEMKQPTSYFDLVFGIKNCFCLRENMTLRKNRNVHHLQNWVLFEKYLIWRDYTRCYSLDYSIRFAARKSFSINLKDKWSNSS